MVDFLLLTERVDALLEIAAGVVAEGRGVAIGRDERSWEVALRCTPSAWYGRVRLRPPLITPSVVEEEVGKVAQRVPHAIGVHVIGKGERLGATVTLLPGQPALAVVVEEVVRAGREADRSQGMGAWPAGFRCVCVFGRARRRS